METPLTKKQMDILIGSLLGDGGIYSRNNKKGNYYIKQAPKNKDYIFWLYKKLENLTPSAPKQRKDNDQWYFYSSQKSNLMRLQRIFYTDRKKIVPTNIADLLISPISLAVWYMEDGTLDYRPKDHCAFYLSTHCFSVEETEKLASILKNNFDIDASVYNNLIRGKRYPRIVIGSKGRQQFFTLIKPYIVDCFKYKLPPIDYNFTLQRLNLK